MSFSCAAVILFVNYLHLEFALSNVPAGVSAIAVIAAATHWSD